MTIADLLITLAATGLRFAIACPQHHVRRRRSGLAAQLLTELVAMHIDVPTWA